MSDHEDETITAENAPPKNISQITTVTNISAKFPYLKKGEYDIWAMKMQNFISSSDLLCWHIVLKRNSAKSMTTDSDGNLKIRPPITAEEHQQVQREEKARTILLSALPDEHMGEFYHMIDARDIWSAIKARFGGNAESKKMQKSLLKQKFEEFKISEEEGLDKGYDKMQKILTQMNTLKIKPDPEAINMKFLRGLPSSWSGIALILKTKGGLEYISFDDLYNKLEFLEIDTKGDCLCVVIAGVERFVFKASSFLYLIELSALTSTSLRKTNSSSSSSSLFWSLYLISLGQGVSIMPNVQDFVGWSLGFAIPTMAMVVSVIMFSCGSRFYSYGHDHDRRNDVKALEKITEAVKCFVSKIIHRRSDKKSSLVVLEIALNLTNEEWIGLMDQVWANPTLSVELLGADVSEDTFSLRMVELMNQWRKAIAKMKAKAKRDKPLTPAQQKEYMRAFIRRAVDLATAKDHHQQLKRSGETLESSESKRLKRSHSTEQPAELQETTSVFAGAIIAAGDPISDVPSVSAASSVPAETPIVAGVSTTAGVSKSAGEASVPIIDLLNSPPKATSLPLDPETAAQAVPLRKSSRKNSMARRRTLPRPSQSEYAALPFNEDDPETEFKKYLRQVSDDDEPAEPVSLSLVSDIRTWDIIPTEFGLGKIHVITRADGTVKRFSTLRELTHWWEIRSWRFYALPAIHVLETKAGDIMYMFVDKKYPILPTTIQRMLNHGLEIDRDLSGNDLTTAIQLIQSLLNQLHPAT
nr:ribonuclease H-like domain-containing protein [Tanacetum cinerariifolium]